MCQLESPVQLRNGEEFNPDGQMLICKTRAGLSASSCSTNCCEVWHFPPTWQQLAVPLVVLQELRHPGPPRYTSSSAPCFQAVVKYTQSKPYHLNHKWNSQPRCYMGFCCRASDLSSIFLLQNWNCTPIKHNFLHPNPQQTLGLWLCVTSWLSYVSHRYLEVE